MSWLRTSWPPDAVGPVTDGLVVRAVAGTAFALCACRGAGVSAGFLTRSAGGGICLLFLLLSLPVVVVTAAEVTAFLPHRAGGRRFRPHRAGAEQPGDSRAPGALGNDRQGPHHEDPAQAGAPRPRPSGGPGLRRRRRTWWSL